MTFELGADLIARHLGFDDDDKLAHWAHARPNYWGYPRGVTMFCSNSYRAFGFTEENKDKITLLDIAKHYRLVANNLLKS